MATATIPRNVPKRAHSPSSMRRDDFQALLRPAYQTTTGAMPVIDWLNEQGIPNEFDHEHTQALVLLAQEGDQDALNEIVKLNLRLVYTIASKYVRAGVDVWDLMSEGSLGVVRAVEKFDERRSSHFSTYAVWWIRCFIAREARQTRSAIRMPDHAVILADQVMRLTAYDNMTAAEAAEALHVDMEDVQAVRRSSRVLSLDREKDAHSHHADELTHTLLDDIADETMANDSTTTLDAIARGDALDLLRATLTAREFDIVCMRYGFPPHDRVHTLIEVGKVVGVTRERVRQLEVAALSKLRHPDVAAQLRELLSDSGE